MGFEPTSYEFWLHAFTTELSGVSLRAVSRWLWSNVLYKLHHSSGSLSLHQNDLSLPNNPNSINFLNFFLFIETHLRTTQQLNDSIKKLHVLLRLYMWLILLCYRHIYTFSNYNFPFFHFTFHCYLAGFQFLYIC